MVVLGHASSMGRCWLFRDGRRHCGGHLFLWDVCSGGKGLRGQRPRFPLDGFCCWQKGVWNPATACVASPAPSWPLPQMAVLEIQSNGDSSVTKEAIERARHSLDDPNMRVRGSTTPLGWGRG